MKKLMIQIMVTDDKVATLEDREGIPETMSGELEIIGLLERVKQHHLKNMESIITKRKRYKKESDLINK